MASWRNPIPMTPSSGPSLVIRFCVAAFDYVLVGVLACVGALWWTAACFGFDTNTGHETGNLMTLIVGWTLLALVLCWFNARGRVWRVVGAVSVLAVGVVGLLWVRAIARELNDEMSSHALIIFQIGVFALCLVVTFMVRRWALKRGWLSAVSRTVLAASLAGYLVYLSWDEAAAPSVAHNHAAMAGRCEDETSYLLTLRYTPAPGGGRVFTAPTCKLDFTKKGEKRREYLLAHRAEIEANWAELADVRAWWAEMAAQPQLGDQPSKNFSHPFIRFQPVRVYTHHALAIAALKALDGDESGALALVGDVYRVGALLEPASCTLVRSMIAITTQKQALETAEFVLDLSTQGSNEARARCVTMLTAGTGDGLEAKRLVLTEATGHFWKAETIAGFGAGASLTQGDTWPAYLMQRVVAVMFPVMVNPQATSNLLHGYHEGMALRAEARDMTGMASLDESMRAGLGGFKVKNLSGRMLLSMSISSYDRVVKSYWETEDLRSVVEKRLREVSSAR